MSKFIVKNANVRKSKSPIPQNIIPMPKKTNAIILGEVPQVNKIGDLDYNNVIDNIDYLNQKLQTITIRAYNQLWKIDSIIELLRIMGIYQQEKTTPLTVNFNIIFVYGNRA